MEPVGIFPRLYTRRSEPLSSFDNLIDFTNNLTYLPDADMDEYAEAYMDVDKWMYHWMVHLCGGHGDWWGNNYFIVLTYDEDGQPDMWKPYEFDFDMMFGCRGGGSGGWCPPYNQDPWWVGPSPPSHPSFNATKFHYRCADNPELRNRMKTVLNDVIKNYWRNDVMFAEMDWLLAEYAQDRQNEISRWGTSYITSDSQWNSIKSYFTNRRNWLISWLNGQGIPTLPNEHPTIDLQPMQSDYDGVSGAIEIPWNYADTEGNNCRVDLYWTDRNWSGFQLIDSDIPAKAGNYSWQAADIPDADYLWIHAVIWDNFSTLDGFDTRLVDY
jgi:hypothetical protein